MSSAPTGVPADGPALFYRSMVPQPDWNIYRQGDQIVFSHGVPFPPYCIKCGEPATRTLRKTLYWHPRWLYMIAVWPGVLFYVIAALVIRAKYLVELPVCETHRVKRLRWMGAAWAAAGLSVAAPFAMHAVVPMEQSDGLVWMFTVPVVGLLVAIIVAMVGTRLVVPTFIDKQVVRARGAGPAFLARCPWMPGTAPPG